MKKNTQPDITVQNGGSVVLLQPNSDAAREWIDENIGEGNGFQPYWPTVVCEARFVEDIIQEMQSDGLEVA